MGPNIAYRIIPNKGTTLIRAPPPPSLAKTKSINNDKSFRNSFNNCSIFNPKPPLESSEPQLQPYIITFKLVRAPAPLLGIIRFIKIPFLERIEKPVRKNGPPLNLTQLDQNDLPRILLNIL